MTIAVLEVSRELKRQELSERIIPQQQFTHNAYDDQHILVISPYADFNQLALDELSWIFKGSHVSTLDHAEINAPPYSYVPGKDSIHPPTQFYMILDFQKTVAHAIPSQDQIL